MATVYLGKHFFANLISDKEIDDGHKAMVYIGVQRPVYNQFLVGGEDGTFVLEIFCGDVSVTPEETELLVKFILPKNSFSIELDNTGMTVVCAICVDGAYAIRSGNASWFKITNTNNPMSYIIGDVGVFGSEATLKVQSTDIISGQIYKSFGIKLKFNNRMHVVV